MSETSSTSSLGFSAFLMMEGFELAEDPVRGREKYKLTFKINRDIMDQKYQEFQRSKFFNYDSIVQTLKRKLRDSEHAYNIN